MPTEKDRSDKTTSQPREDADFFREVPVSLYGCEELREKYRVAACEQPAKLVALWIGETFLPSEVMKVARMVHKQRCYGALGTKVTVGDLSNHAWVLLREEPLKVRPFDPAHGTLSGYLGYVVRRALDFFRGQELTRRRVVRPDSHDAGDSPACFSSRRPRYGPLPANLAAPAAGSEPERAEAVRAAVARGPWSDTERAILDRHYGEGASLTEVAGELNMTADAVHQAHARLKAKLRRRLDQDS